MTAILLLPLLLCADIGTHLDSASQKIRRTGTHLQRRATRAYHRFLYSLDSYLGGGSDLNRTEYRRIRKSRLLVIASLHDSSSFSLHLRGKITLPRTKNRLELLFSQDDGKELDNQKPLSAQDDAIRDTKLHVGLKYYFYKKRTSSAYAKLNFHLTSHFGPYIKLGATRSIVTRNFYEITFDHALYYYLNGGDLSAATSVSFFKPLNNTYWIGQGDKLYYNGDERLYLQNSLLLYQILDLNNRIIYKTALTTAYDQTERLRQEDAEVSAGWFHRFDKWYFAELIPKLRKRRETHYRNEAVVSLNFGMLLGH